MALPRDESKLPLESQNGLIKPEIRWEMRKNDLKRQINCESHTHTFELRECVRVVGVLYTSATAGNAETNSRTGMNGDCGEMEWFRRVVMMRIAGDRGGM